MDFRLATLAAHKEYTQRIRMHNSSSPRPPHIWKHKVVAAFLIVCGISNKV